MSVYYNENNPKKAEWLRQLIKLDVIAPGDVDERSIKEVSPEDVRHYTQCHWFAGIGVWSYALRLAGWSDDNPVWTGSCPCQSFSRAGKQLGTSDPRHLWPDWFKLIQECRPSVIFGEQVEAAIRKGWLDLVQDDLEGEDYTFGKIVLPACSIGADHLRQRIWFIAVSNTHSKGSQRHQFGGVGSTRERCARSRSLGMDRDDYTRSSYRDGKKRRIKPSIKPLVDVSTFGMGSSRSRSIEETDFDNTPEARAMRIEGYGDAIVAELAAEFINVGMEWLSNHSPDTM